MSKKKEMAGKMVSKEYTNVRCGHCGKFGHSHEDHNRQASSIFPYSIGPDASASSITKNPNFRKK